MTIIVWLNALTERTSPYCLAVARSVWNLSKVKCKLTPLVELEMEPTISHVEHIANDELRRWSWRHIGKPASQVPGTANNIEKGD